MQYGRPFDHKAHAGQVYGDNRFAYEQGGQLYDAHKRPVDAKGNLMDLDPKLKRSAAPPAAPKAAQPKPGIHLAQPVEDAEDDADVENEAPQDEPPADDEEEQIDLVAWAKGHTPSIAWATVKDAIFKQLNVRVQKKADAVELILSKTGAAPVQPTT